MSISTIPEPNVVDTYQLGYYVVCVIDLLAQKDKLKGWETLSANGQVTSYFEKALQDTVGSVLIFYESFVKYFNNFKQPSQNTEYTEQKMRGEDRELYHRLKDCELGVVQFSDTFVFYAPLATSNGELSVLPVYRILTACSMAMMLSLAAKIPLRGGIHIGAGVKIPELSFYGPALAGAHRLESCVAQYPRVVVSEDLIEFVKHTPLSTGSTFNDRWMKEMLEICRSLLAIDAFDNQPFVDWLGAGYRRVSGWTGDPQNSKDLNDALKKAYDFVGQSAKVFEKRFETTKDPIDEKLSKRYSALYRYLCARLPEWGITKST